MALDNMKKAFDEARTASVNHDAASSPAMARRVQPHCADHMVYREGCLKCWARIPPLERARGMQEKRDAAFEVMRDALTTIREDARNAWLLMRGSVGPIETVAHIAEQADAALKAAGGEG